VEAAVAGVPDAWLASAGDRGAYVDHLLERLSPPRSFALEAEEARARL
jgi:hypothetical protein